MKDLINKHVPFSAEQRSILLKEYFSAQKSLSEITALIDRSSGTDSQRLQEHERFYRRRLLTLRMQYIAGVPVIELSRCPFSNEVMRHSLDNYDLDGLWWNYEYPARPESPLLKTYVALTGAVKLNSNIKKAPFVCKPGPEVPYVIPRLLKRPSVIAVISSVKIGDHQGYITTYFGDPPPQKIPRVNTWGSNTYIFLDEQGNRKWDSEPENQFDFDFDLEPWISNKQVRWIAPGDNNLTLHDEVSGCPYLGLEGIKKSLVIYEGEISYPGKQ
jgi:hypothetical protein